MSDIQDEAYSEAMDEIALLKNEILELGHRVKLSEYQRLQSLCKRAADAMEAMDLYTDRFPAGWTRLMEELRKAAQ